MTQNRPQPLEVDEAELRERGVLPETFAAAYQESPPWVIGKPQPVVTDLLAEGAFAGRMLDLGCGTGENAVLLAKAGLEVVGVDIVAAPLEIARQKAADAGLENNVTFMNASALDLPEELGTFDTVLDSATFHVFSDADRARYVASVARRLRSGGRLYLICFSEAETRDGGPRRLSKADIYASFAGEWKIEAIDAVRYEVTMYPDGARGWLATIRKE